MGHPEDTLKLLKETLIRTDDIKGTVLEIGKGDTLLFKEFFTNEFNMRYLALDNDKSLRESHNTIIGDMHNIPFQDNTFEIIFSCHSFEHSENPIKVIEEMFRVVKNECLVVVATPTYCELNTINVQGHLFVLSEHQIRKLFEYCGFEILMIKYSVDKNLQITDIDTYAKGTMLTIAKKKYRKKEI